MRFMAAITLLILAIVIAQPVAAQSFKPDLEAGWKAIMKSDYATALKHYRSLAKQGHAGAQNNLGQMYYMGLGVTKDSKQAVRWYRKAAKQGHYLAQAMLGWMYSNGRGVMHDDVMAYVWSNVAAANGSEEASGNIKFYAKRLDKADLKKAQILSRRCRKKPARCPEYSDD